MLTLSYDPLLKRPVPMERLGLLQITLPVQLWPIGQTRMRKSSTTKTCICFGVGSLVAVLYTTVYWLKFYINSLVLTVNFVPLDLRCPNTRRIYFNNIGN